MQQSFLVLFGSGETSSTGRQIHEFLLKKIAKKDIRIALLTTPAGFQPNVSVVYETIAEFFKTGLANFHPQIEIIYANNRELANDNEVIAPLERADYIFTGPGSPTYAVKHLQDTFLLEKLKKRIKDGITLSLSSAATIAFSKFALPVYEIYKVGTDLYWEKGLDFYKDFYKSITVIPHYNNTEGGVKNDTSHCYMGKDRFTKLAAMLKGEEVIGIDEHTGMIIDLETKEIQTMGKGKLHTL